MEKPYEEFTEPDEGPTAMFLLRRWIVNLDIERALKRENEMLANNFLTAADLRIDPAHHAALIKLLGMMERGELTYVPPRGPGHVAMPKPMTKYGFNMAVWGLFNECGTVACIGGWMESLSGVSLNELVIKNKPLNRLFHLHDECTVYMEEITVEQAAAALRNYLTTGAARWEEVL